MWVVDPKWYYMGCHRNLKYIFLDGEVKRKLNYMGGGLINFRPVCGITSKFYVQATRVEYISPTTHQKAFIFGP